MAEAQSAVFAATHMAGRLRAIGSLPHATHLQQLAARRWLASMVRIGERKPRLRRELRSKKEQGSWPCSENCVDPIYPDRWILSLIGGLTLLKRVRVPPETWTVLDLDHRRFLADLSEFRVVAELFVFVINFGIVCSKLRHA
jgi:hypothetical protein